MRWHRTLLFMGFWVVLLGGLHPVYGQSESKSKFKADSTWKDWNLRLSPYFWLIGIQGQITVAPEPAHLPHLPPPPEQLPSGHYIYDIDLSFQDVRNSLKFALMLAGQYKFERIITQFNVSSFVLESTAKGPFDFILQGNSLRFAYAGGDVGAGYRVVRNNKLEFDVLLGVKFVYFKTILESDFVGIQPISAKLERLWTDPVLATNFTYRPHNRVELVALGDIGAPIFDDKFTYQFAFSSNFLITKHIYLSAGYRNYYVKYPREEAVFVGILHGMIVKIGVQF